MTLVSKFHFRERIDREREWEREMAEAAVDFLMENLKQLLLYHTSSISKVKNEIEHLESDLHIMRAFLRDAEKKRKKSEILIEAIRQIRDLLYEAEDVIDIYMLEMRRSSRSFIKKFAGRHSTDYKVAEQLAEVRARMKQILYNMKMYNLNQELGDTYEASLYDRELLPLVRKDNVVGLEEEADKLIQMLIEDSDKLDVISIVGMSGLGKTTLAGKVFRDPAIQYEFPTRIWVYVSQDYRRKDIFLSILHQFTRIQPDMYEKTDKDLAYILLEYMERGNCLIILDDVCTTSAWEDLRIAFPSSNEHIKILITSWDEDVARYSNPRRESFKLRFLTLKESETLLKLQVFGQPECPSDLERFVTHIASQCSGLPLAILIIAGIILRRADSIDWWSNVSKNVGEYLHSDHGGRMRDIISISYDRLPSHLRACFLYLGIFPEDYEIPVSRLIRLWIAEGFIEQETAMSLEEVGEEYLNDLIRKNLVMVGSRSYDGRVRTCRVHDTLRDFCRHEAEKEENQIFKEVSTSADENFNLENIRRLCVHFEVSKFLSRPRIGPRVRSLLFFSKEEIELPPENGNYLFKSCKLLRVLDGNSIKLMRFPADLVQMFHLKYIALSGPFGVLPAAISNLWNLQTLIFYTSKNALEVKADLLAMIQLRHIKTNVSTTFPKTTKSKGSSKLQTLSAISPQSCTKAMFAATTDLKKLVILGELSLVLQGKTGGSTPFDCIRMLDYLEKLKLVNDTASKTPLPSLPQEYNFPSKLRCLTLGATRLDWKHMSTLAMLETLEVLKLKDYAFVGTVWEPTDGGFRRLEALLIEGTDLVSWIASGHHFPRLRCLTLKNCEELAEVPSGLAYVPTLNIMDLVRTSKKAAASARKIKEMIQEMQGQHGSKSSGLQLSIYPPDL